MNNSIIPFDFKGNQFRAITDIRDGSRWFVAKDVCGILRLSDVSMSIQRLDEDEKLVQKLFVSGQNRDLWLVNESGLYNLILRSRKLEAKKFRRWVTHEIIPAIRKRKVFSCNNLTEFFNFFDLIFV